MTEPKTFRLYVIHTQSLTTRQSRLHGTIQSIRQIVQAMGLRFQSILILKPDPHELIPNLGNLNARVTYTSVGDTDFDRHTHTLNIEEISNIEKHREAWRRIVATNNSQNDIIMVMEDDNLLPSENSGNLATVITAAAANTNSEHWDFLDLNMSKQDEKDDPSKLMLYPLHDHVKVLVSKQAYMLTPKMAKMLLAETETIRFTARVQISYALYCKRNEYKARITSKRLMLEGSKVGVYPTSLHANNVLIYNAEYMKLYNMLKEGSANIKEKEEEVRALYRTVAHVKNPDLMNVYGMALYAMGKNEEALAIWDEGLDQLQKQQGLINQQSDLLNNIINSHASLQNKEIEEYMKTPSKFMKREVGKVNGL